MPIKTEFLTIVLVLVAGCPEPTEPDPVEQAPDPIGDELLRYEGTWAVSTCARSHLYREGRQVQLQCFDAQDGFTFENRGTLTVEWAAALDAASANADLDATEPVNYMGFCGAPDSHGTVTLWAGERSVSFEPSCLTTGIVELFERANAIHVDLSGCDEPLTTLESLEPGCRWR